jgi:hypothetical protein
MMCASCLARAAKLRCIALDFRTVAEKGDTSTLSRRMTETAAELEEIAAGLERTCGGRSDDVVWAEDEAKPAAAPAAAR